MKAYKVYPPRKIEPVAVLSMGENSASLDQAFKEFQTTYGFDSSHTIRDLRRRSQAQMNLARDASFLGLEHNPLYHELSLVFVDWLKKRFGYKQVDLSDIKETPEEFRFPY